MRILKRKNNQDFDFLKEIKITSKDDLRFTALG